MKNVRSGLLLLKLADRRLRSPDRLLTFLPQLGSPFLDQSHLSFEFGPEGHVTLGRSNQTRRGRIDCTH
ncbi:hypothetical protein MPNT_30158 [Candidatus Methylacidithermus pantelleriae]|uniref:Uncharacterized protein n=1 Tax=Candidatus Methylacidithermus pantelleriae TaxID=2744239 RepID=A0A8J2BJ83_9BACT|nr:hypothetical protein MPNT_30158 [Candidatus Methylacidithermus pantelleriae]